MMHYAQLQPPMNYNVRYLSTWKKPVDWARNWLAERAIEAEAKYLFFMDEDVCVPPHAIRQLIYRLEHNPEAAVAGGIYCLKTDYPEPLVFVDGDGKGCYWDWHAGELFECSGIGMGCAMIRVEALAAIAKPWFQTVDDNSASLEGHNRATAWTEDLWFCKQVREAGFKLLADGAILADHLDIGTGKAYRLPPDSKPAHKVGVVKGTKKILDIGAGTSPYQTDEGEVVTFDARADTNPDYRGDARRLPFADGQFDVVHSSHTLEHFGRHEADDVLDEWCRVLRPGGALKLVLPNLQWAAERIMEGKIDANVMNVLYGEQSYSLNFHRTGFTPDMVERALKLRNYETEIKLDGYNILVWATKPEAKTDEAWHGPIPLAGC